MTEAPRLLHYWGRTEGVDILSMRRSEWHDLVGHEGKAIAFDVRSTPMRGISDVASVIGTIAHQFTPDAARVSIYRDDPKDAPNRVNVDHYKVWTDLTAHPRLPNMIEAASTSYNENMRTFIQKNVFLVKEKPGSDHWMPTLPSSVYVVLKST
jgi:hypothetical protein